jgi:septum formation protein
MVILASGSPRRREIAAGENWRLLVIEPPPHAEALEAPRRSGETLEAYVMRLAAAKGRGVEAIAPDGIILACDTLSEVDGVSLGKPADEEDARRMLRLLSGRRHRVVTGTWLLRKPGGPVIAATTESLLRMAELSEEFLEAYLTSGLWRGKAGACGFQDGVIPLELVAGSPSNVVGLPVETVRDGIRELLAGMRRQKNPPAFN